MAQDKSTITVKGSEVNNGVVILTVQQAATPEQAAESFVLHCNKGMSELQGAGGRDLLDGAAAQELGDVRLYQRRSLSQYG